MTLPNAITFGRLALVPIFIVFAYSNSNDAAAGIFVLASASDLVDGYLARRQSTVSRLGEFLDPTADKVLVGAALVVLVATTPFPLWAALLIAVREVAVQVLRTQIVTAGGQLPASPAGKVKTVVQMVMVSWWLLFSALSPLHWILLAVVLGATYWSGLEYFVHAQRVKEAVR